MVCWGTFQSISIVTLGLSGNTKTNPMSLFGYFSIHSMFMLGFDGNPIPIPWFVGVLINPFHCYIGVRGKSQYQLHGSCLDTSESIPWLGWDYGKSNTNSMVCWGTFRSISMVMLGLHGNPRPNSMSLSGVLFNPLNSYVGVTGNTSANATVCLGYFSINSMVRLGFDRKYHANPTSPSAPNLYGLTVCLDTFQSISMVMLGLQEIISPNPRFVGVL